MKLFVVHFNIGCCANNSDGKMWVVAESEYSAKIIANGHTNYSITYVEEYNVANELIFSSFHCSGNYKMKDKTDNYG